MSGSPEKPKGKGRGRRIVTSTAPDATAVAQALQELHVNGGGDSNGNGNGNGNGHKRQQRQATIAKVEAEEKESIELAIRPDAGGSAGLPRQIRVNFFPVTVNPSSAFHLYTLKIVPTRWKEFSNEGKAADQRPPAPLNTIEKQELFNQLIKNNDIRKGFDWGNKVNQMAYDGNATLVTANPIPSLAKELGEWNPSGGRIVPTHHFGEEQSGAVDEDARGREISMNRFEATLSHETRPNRYRASVTPVLNKESDVNSTSNKFMLSKIQSSSKPIASTEYQITSTQVLDTIFSQWCVNYESQQSDAWYGRKQSVALANPYAENMDKKFKIEMPNGTEVWYGLYFATRIGKMDGVNTPFNCLDTASGVMFTEQSFMNFCAQLLGGLREGTPYPQTFTPAQALQINKNAAGMKVRSKHIPRNYVVKSFNNGQVPCESRFHCEKLGGEVTVEEYFLKQYKYKLQFPRMGMVEVKTPGDKKTMYLPIELLDIRKKQEANKALPDNAASIMIKKLCTPAPERQSRVMRLAEMARFGADAWSGEFQLGIKPQMHGLQGRVLPPPPIAFGRGTAQIKDGVWNTLPLVEGKDMPDQTVLVLAFARIHPQITDIASKMWDSLRQAANKLGMNVGGRIFTFNQALSTDYDQIVKQICGAVHQARDHEKRISHMIVIMKERNPTLYSTVKFVGDHFLGVPSQCLLLKTISPLKSMTALNILIKMNAKMGGANWRLQLENLPPNTLAFMREPSLILGIDVSHPKPGDARLPSLAAVVGNTDRDITKFNATMGVSRPNVEEVPYLRYAVEKRMFEYVKKTRKNPKHIIIYRDGVSESQYEKVMDEELIEIRNSVQKMFGGSEFVPKLTVIVCIKRHHVRMFPTNPQEAVGKSQNVAPGTVIDTEVASPHEFDFWLMSHFGLQGTCRPTYYKVLYDEAGMSSDSVQLMTYWLCHMFYRCPRAVSYPAPTYYAHLAAERARAHLAAEYTSREDTKTTSTSSGDDGHSHGPGGDQYTGSHHRLTHTSAGTSSNATSSSSSDEQAEEAGIKSPEDIYSGVSQALKRLQLAATVSQHYLRNDNLYFA